MWSPVKATLSASSHFGLNLDVDVVGTQAEMCCDFGNDGLLDFSVTEDEVSADGERVASHSDVALVVCALVAGNTEEGVEAVCERPRAVEAVAEAATVEVKHGAFGATLNDDLDGRSRQCDLEHLFPLDGLQRRLPAKGRQAQQLPESIHFYS